MWTWTSLPLTIIPALSPPQVPTTSVIGVEVAAEQATAARIAGRKRIRAIPKRYRRITPRSIWAKRLPGQVLLELRVERRSSLPPIRAHLLFGPDVDVARRNQLLRPLDLDQHYSFDRIPGAFLSEDPLRRLAKDFVITMQLRATEESVYTSPHLLHDVDLYEWIALEIRPRSRRRDVEKEDVLVVPDPNRSFG